MDIAMCGEGVEYGGVCPRSCTSVHGVVLGYRGGVAATPYTTSGHWKLVTHSPHIVVVCLDPLLALYPIGRTPEGQVGTARNNNSPLRISPFRIALLPRTRTGVVYRSADVASVFVA